MAVKLDPFIGKLRQSDRFDVFSPSNIQLAGHSYADEKGVGIKHQPAKHYALGGRIASMFGIPLNRINNLAKSGAAMRAHNTNGAPRYLQNVNPGRRYLPQISRTGLSFIWFGVNDLILATGTEVRDGFKHGLRSLIARYRACAVFDFNDATVVTSGTWADTDYTALSTPLGSGVGCTESSTTNDTVTITFPSDLFNSVEDGLWITLGFVGGYAGATATIDLDGVEAGTINTGNLTLSNLTAERSASVFRVWAPVGSEEIVITVTGQTNSGVLRFDYWAVEALIPPLVLVGECTVPPNPGGLWAAIDATRVDTLNGWQNEVIAEFTDVANGDPNVRMCMLDTALGGQNIRASGQGSGADHTYYNLDGLHPNERGTQRAAEAISDAVHEALNAGVSKQSLNGYFSGERQSIGTGDVATFQGDGTPPLLVDDFDGLDSTSTPSGWTVRKGAWGIKDEQLGFYGDVGSYPTFWDTFNRANGAMGADWTSVRGTWEILDNAASLTTTAGGGDQLVISSETLVGGNGYVEAQTTSSRETGAGIVFRYQDTSNYWKLTMNITFGTWVLVKVVAGSATTVQNGAMGNNLDGTQIHVELSGSAIQIYNNGAFMIEKTDAALATATGTGLIAITSSSTDPRLENFKVGAYVDYSDLPTFNYLARDHGESDGVFQFKVGDVAADNNGAIFRYVDENNYLNLVMSTTFGNWVFSKCVAGTTTTVLNGLVGANASSTVISIVMSGDNFNFYFNGEASASGQQTVASAPAGTIHGLRINNKGVPTTSAVFDDVAFGQVYVEVEDDNSWRDNLTGTTYGPFIAGIPQQTIPFIPSGLYGEATLVAGTVVVSNTRVTNDTHIMLTPQNTSGTAGSVYVSARTAGTSFTITSTNGADTRSVAYLIIEPEA